MDVVLVASRSCVGLACSHRHLCGTSGTSLTSAVTVDRVALLTAGGGRRCGGRDRPGPQLEAAVEIRLAELSSNPVQARRTQSATTRCEGHPARRIIVVEILGPDTSTAIFQGAPLSYTTALLCIFLGQGANLARAFFLPHSLSS